MRIACPNISQITGRTLLHPSRNSLSVHLRRCYSSHPPNAKLNVPIDFSNTKILSHNSNLLGIRNPELNKQIQNGPSEYMKLCDSIKNALDLAMNADDTVLVFGEDVVFGGVFRCTLALADNYGHHRVFNTPLCEQGIVGFGIGVAAQGYKAVAEIQFADYVYPSFDQLVNEAAKFRYRDGKEGRNVAGLTVRMPCGAVGHGALYHSQSPESLFSHIPGLRVIMPRSPIQAKGLLTSAIFSNDPCIFMEPKGLYRAAAEYVPTATYTLPLSKAEILREGSDITVVSYGQPLYACSAAIDKAEADFGITIELIDLRTLFPFDKDCVLKSVQKTGRCIIVHESMINAGIGAEVAASIQEDQQTFLRLEAPIMRVAGWSIHMPLLYERFVIPDVARIYDSIKKALEY